MEISCVGWRRRPEEIARFGPGLGAQQRRKKERPLENIPAASLFFAQSVTASADDLVYHWPSRPIRRAISSDPRGRCFS